MYGRVCFKNAMVVLLLLISCGLPGASTSGAGTKPSPCDYVNPFIGTRDMGHTFPGAAVPFGLVQLSPDTDTIRYSYGEGYNPAVYRYCAGYQYDDPTIVGFSHTHFSGTGHSDLGDFLVMPTVGPARLNPGTAGDPDGGYRSRFSHDREEASPGYYAVDLLDYGIRAELTATPRVGVHRYTFPASDEAHIILDLTAGIYDYDGKVVWASVRVEDDTLVTGFRQTSGWARTRYLYFAMTFSKPMRSYGLHNDERPVYRGFWRKWNEDEGFPERAGRRVRCRFDFGTVEGESIVVKMALSSVSARGALENLRAELPHADFDRARAEARRRWDEELSRISIEADGERLVNFYTAMYHAFLSPVVWSDVSGEYRGLDREVHAADGGANYTIFSLWDTYRALHPLLTIVQQARTDDMVRSMLAHAGQSVHGILPVWSHHGEENWCMIGYHAVPVIFDAWQKGIRGYDVEGALDAMIASATYAPYDGIGDYERYGYVPGDRTPDSASKTLEYAYDDWTIYRMALALGRDEQARRFGARAGSWRSLFDPATGFIRARLADGSWKPLFDPLATSGQGYIEGNAWNYSLYVPHDPAGLIELMGGRDRFVPHLDSLFTMETPEESYAHTEDITKAGIIGTYVHGNEPGHHIPYLYVWAGAPWRTQERVHQITETMYRNANDGLCGNDDCGQMSAWYIFSMLGFYPVCPGSGEYVFGSPGVREATISLENGKSFAIRAEGLDGKNIYIRSITLNGEPYRKSFITHAEIMRGGELVFEMDPAPVEAWPDTREALPYSMSTPRR